MSSVIRYRARSLRLHAVPLRPYKTDKLETTRWRTACHTLTVHRHTRRFMLTRKYGFSRCSLASAVPCTSSCCCAEHNAREGTRLSERSMLRSHRLALLPQPRCQEAIPLCPLGRQRVEGVDLVIEPPLSHSLLRVGRWQHVIVFGEQSLLRVFTERWKRRRRRRRGCDERFGSSCSYRWRDDRRVFRLTKNGRFRSWVSKTRG